MEKELLKGIIRENLNGEKFNMSGYDGKKKGSCTLQNQELLNRFAYLGIYDYTEFLFLDFYKGSPTIYLKYWGDNETIEIGMTGATRTEIIYHIIELTVLSGNKKRRRN